MVAVCAGATDGHPHLCVDGAVPRHLPLHRICSLDHHSQGDWYLCLAADRRAALDALARCGDSAQHGHLAAADLSAAGGHQPGHGPLLAGRAVWQPRQGRAGPAAHLRRRQRRCADRRRPAQRQPPLCPGRFHRRRPTESGPKHQRPACLLTRPTARPAGTRACHRHPAGPTQHQPPAPQPDHCQPAAAAGAHPHPARPGRPGQRARHRGGLS